MSVEEESIEIKLLNEEAAAQVEVRPTAAEKMKGAAAKASRRAASAAQSGAQKAWNSDARKRVTTTIGEKTSAAVQQRKEAIEESVKKAVNERIDHEKERVKAQIRETDWRALAKKSLATGFKAASIGLEKLSKKLAPKQNPPSEDEET